MHALPLVFIIAALLILAWSAAGEDPDNIADDLDLKHFAKINRKRGNSDGTLRY